MVLRPMLLRPGAIPTGAGRGFELKYDGFRAIVSTENGLDVRSRRNWRMADRVPELEQLPPGFVLGGELVAFNNLAHLIGRCFVAACFTETPRYPSRSLLSMCCASTVTT